ncbi:YitT family protein [Massilia sp. W12]|uniref:YitT family protein n=1 Tax=Massilia sp. W12 TaxID=3126507 RepID=UPI0030CBE4DC
MSTASPPPDPAARVAVGHSLIEDVLALFTGAVLVSLGVSMFKQTGLLTGGTAGLAFLLHYLAKISFGWAFFAINLPFYWLAWRRMGPRFTVKTFCAIALVASLSDLHPRLFQLHALTPFYVALIGGVMMGAGFIILFRHQASLGGFNILALYLQEKYRIPAGKLLLGLDLSILLIAVSFAQWPLLLASVLGAVMLNVAITLNHKAGRYVAV